MSVKTSISYRKIWGIAYPIFLTLLVQNLIQVTDTAFLGRVGEVELGASALAGIYYVVVFIIAFGFSTGSQILIGRRNGEGNFHQIGEIVIYGLLFLILLALVLFGLTRIFSKQILSLILSSPQVLDATMEFLNPRMYGIFFSSFNVMFRAFYVGTTRTKVLSVNAVLMALCNVFFAYALIFGNFGFPQMGIAGAAIASVISEALSVVFFIGYTFFVVDLKKYGFHTQLYKSKGVIGKILDISSSIMLQNLLSLGSWFFFFIAVEHLGERPLAVSNIVRSLYMLISIPIFALAATTNTLVSNAIGAGKTEEVIDLVWKIIRLAWIIVSGLLLLVLLSPRFFISIYTTDIGMIIDTVPTLCVVVLLMPVIAMANIFFNSVSGTGNTRTALGIECCVLLIYVSYTCISTVYLKLPLPICWLNELIYAFFIFLFCFLYIKKGNWRDKKI